VRRTSAPLLSGEGFVASDIESLRTEFRDVMANDVLALGKQFQARDLEQLSNSYVLP